MYLDSLAAKIRKQVPDERMPAANSDELFRLYAVLLRAKGANVTQSDVHDAWSVWMARHDDEHEALFAYEGLSEDVREEDRVFATAIRKAADELCQAGGSRPAIAEILFPSGPPANEAETRQTFDLYKIMVDSSEGLVSRRQSVNTFFLTMNGALLTASGIIVQSSSGNRLSGVGIAVLAIAGAVLCTAWRSLITSFGQLNRGKFRVINTIERYLRAAIYAAEWEALGRGENPKIYRSFTSREIWIPNVLLVLYLLTAVGAILFSAGFLSFGGG